MPGKGRQGGGFAVYGLSIGQYEIVSEHGMEYLKSFAFTDHPRVGKISFRDFEKILLENYGSKFESASIKDTTVYKKNVNKGYGRKIASIDEPEEEESSANIFWLALILAGLGIFTGVKLNGRDH